MTDYIAVPRKLWERFNDIHRIDPNDVEEDMNALAACEPVAPKHLPPDPVRSITMQCDGPYLPEAK